MPGARDLVVILRATFSNSLGAGEAEAFVFQKIGLRLGGKLLDEEYGGGVVSDAVVQSLLELSETERLPLLTRVIAWVDQITRDAPSVVHDQAITFTAEWVDRMANPKRIRNRAGPCSCNTKTSEGS